MQIHTRHAPDFTVLNTLATMGIALVYIFLSSLHLCLVRQQFNSVQASWFFATANAFRERFVKCHTPKSV